MSEPDAIDQDADRRDSVPDNVVPLRPGDRTTERPRGLRDVIGDVLRDERTRQDRTLTDVAREAAVSVPYLSEIERGRKEVSSDLLDAVVGALDLELADVLERSARRLRAGSQRSTGIHLLAA